MELSLISPSYHQVQQFWICVWIFMYLVKIKFGSLMLLLRICVLAPGTKVILGFTKETKLTILLASQMLQFMKCFTWPTLRREVHPARSPWSVQRGDNPGGMEQSWPLIGVWIWKRSLNHFIVFLMRFCRETAKRCPFFSKHIKFGILMIYRVRKRERKREREGWWQGGLNMMQTIWRREQRLPAQPALFKLERKWPYIQHASKLSLPHCLSSSSFSSALTHKFFISEAHMHTSICTHIHRGQKMAIG